MELPRELSQMVVDSTPPSTLAQLALVSPALHDQARRALFANIAVSSSAAAQLLLRSLKDDPTLVPLARTLTVERGSAAKLASASKRGKGAAAQWIEDSVTEGELVQLAGLLKELEEIHLREVAFTSLRRRSLSDFTSQLSALHTLSIAGRPSSSSSHPSDTLFNLHTVGQIVMSLPQLQHLALRHVQASPSSLEGLTPYPSFTLTSLALYSTPGLTPKHLHWLLRSTCHAETLRTLALDWNDSPRILNPIRYTVLRVERLHLTTHTPGVIEAFVLHCPSLTRLTIKADVPVDAIRLFANLEHPLLELVDKSEGEEYGVDRSMLGLVIEGRQLKFARKLRRVSVVRREGLEKQLEELRTACEGRKILLEVEEPDQIPAGEPWIPMEFASLRPVDVPDQTDV